MSAGVKIPKFINYNLHLSPNVTGGKKYPNQRNVIADDM